jgi:ABC-type lipoprotein export system ATPase subunit
MPTAGRVSVDGQDPYALSSEARARFRASTLGFVFQQFHLVPYLSVMDNILAPSVALPAPDARTRAAELAERFGLTSRADHVPAELSVGERQRVALARALLNRPKVILADEPTGNLDGANAETVLGHLAAFAQDGGTVLLVTHDPRSTGYAQRTLHMEQGRLV